MERLSEPLDKIEAPNPRCGGQPKAEAGELKPELALWAVRG